MPLLSLDREGGSNRLTLHKSPYFSGLDHAERVRRIAEDIGRRESADLGVLGVAALLNDIGVHIKQTSLDAKPDFIKGNAFCNDINPIYCYGLSA